MHINMKLNFSGRAKIEAVSLEYFKLTSLENGLMDCAVRLPWIKNTKQNTLLYSYGTTIFVKILFFGSYKPIWLQSDDNKL